MSIRLFTPEQIKELLKNPNVAKCTAKSITYGKDFKMMAVKQNQEDHVPSKYIFAKAGFDINIIGHKTPKDCLQRWKKVVKFRGVSGLISEHRGKTLGGGRPKIKSMTDAEKIERLEATVAYLKAEKALFTKLRAQRKS